MSEVGLLAFVLMLSWLTAAWSIFWCGVQVGIFWVVMALWVVHGGR